MNNRLSHSAANKFQECPKAYEYSYVKRLRPKITNSFFMFGRAVDAAAMELLNNPGADYLPAYEKAMAFVDINGSLQSAPRCVNVVYGVSEFDSDLLNEQDRQDAQNLATELFGEGNWEDRLSYIQNERKTMAFDLLERSHREFYNYCNWKCVFRRGQYMIEAFKREFLPKVKKILSVQEKIELHNEHGDSIIGYIDFVADIEGEGVVVFDLKTSASLYDAGAVLTSPQLSLYLSAVQEKYKTEKAGFCVLSKQIVKNKTKICTVCNNDGTGKRHKTCDAEIDGKRCGGEWKETLAPEAIVQLLVNKVPERTLEIVIENYEHVNNAIKHGVFQRNFQSCNKGQFKCQYYNLCYFNKTDGLEEVGERK